MGDVLYFEGESTAPDATRLPNGKPGKFYLKKRVDHNNDIEYGIYDPETYELYPCNPEELIYGPTRDIFKQLQDSINRGFSKAFDGQTKVKRETKYELLDSAITDNAAGYGYDHAVSSGVNVADQFGFSATLGWKISTKIGGGIIPAEVTAEMSTSLSTNYNHSITVTSADTRTHKFTIGKVDNPSYNYKQYTTAVYQLRSTYTTIPGAGLNEVMQKQTQLKGLANKVYKYNEDQLYFGVTPGSHL